MAKIALKYDDRELLIDLTSTNLSVLLPKEQYPDRNAADIVREALTTPILREKDPRIDDFRGKNIAIAINDQTRPLPHAVLIPSLLEHLISIGADKDKITFYIATGTHRKLTDEEIKTVLPGNLSLEYPYFCHNCDDIDNLEYLGSTSRQTPVFVNRRYYRSDVKIVIGNIEPHHFMGFSGGMKTAAIGLTGRATIQKNHSMLPDPHAKMGLYKSNPMRMDVEEIGRLIGVNYALNVVLNDEKQIVKAFWGDPYRVMETGIPYSLSTCQLDVPEKESRFDLVIASAGGYPKDINLYQSQKALTNACLFSRPGGVIILAAGCRDGAGNLKFVEYIRGKKGWKDVLSDFPNHPFEVGPHKAYQLALQVRDHHIILISKLPADEVRQYMLSPADDLQEALMIASQFLPEPCRTVVLPFATHSMPKMDREKG